jgi:RNA polymerase sigma factor (sigma-70 family)
VRVTDADLVRAAQGGDAVSLAMLMDRHRAGMYGVAVAMLGAGSDSEDVVHDAFLAAATRLGTLCDPGAAGAWLRGIVRNLCRERRRGRRELPVGLVPDGTTATEGPEWSIDRDATADWVWTALSGLPGPLREVAVMRYFSHASSYEAIAAVLGVPVGTVRSRLHQARRRLARALQQVADRVHDDHGRVLAARRAFFGEVFAEYNAGLGVTMLTDALVSGAELHSVADPHVYRGAREIAEGLQLDIDAGVHLRILDIVAGSDVTVVEGAFENPAGAPDHCPPVTTQLFIHEGDAIRAVRLHYAESR